MDAARKEILDILSHKLHKIPWAYRQRGKTCNKDDVLKAHKDAIRLIEICHKYPTLALEYYTYSIGALTASDPFYLHNINRCAERGLGMTVLESFLRHRISCHIICDFCELFPEAMSIPAKIHGWLPLHLACELDSTHSLVNYLIQKEPKAASRKDDHGNLPLHILLQSRSHTTEYQAGGGARNPSANAALQEFIIKELEPLVQAYPQATITPGGYLVNLDPMHFVMARQATYSSPEVLECILRGVPTAVHSDKTSNSISLTEFVFKGRKFLNGQTVLCRDYAEVLGRFFASAESLERIVFQPDRVSGHSGRIYTPAGWACLFRSFQNFPSRMKHLEIELPPKTMVQEEDALSAVVETLPQLKTLTNLVISFLPNRMDDPSRTQLLALSRPLADLLAEGNLVELVVKDGINVDLDLELILQAVINRPHSPLRTLDIRPCQAERDMTALFVALLSSANCRLESLAFSMRISFQQQPIFQALANNLHLKTLRAPNLLLSGTNADNPMSLSDVLEHHNDALEMVQSMGASYQEINGLEYERIQLYVRLNRLGRATIRNVRCNLPDILSALERIREDHVLDRDSTTRAGAIYVVLRESPVHWC